MAEQQEPCGAFAAEEQHRAEGMVTYAAQHNVTAGLWQECAQQAFTAAAENASQPPDRP